MNLLLIRHGQSVANQKGLLIANEKDGLTAAGIEQSIKLGNVLAISKNIPSVIYSSPWERAKQTAELIFEQEKTNIYYDASLAETHPGIYGTWQEGAFNNKFPDFYNDLTNRYEEGESHMEMAKRVCHWVDEKIFTTLKEDGLMAIVTHGGPITVVLQYLLGMPIASLYPTFTVSNASYSKLIWREDLNRYCVINIGSQSI